MVSSFSLFLMCSINDAKALEVVYVLCFAGTATTTTMTEHVHGCVSCVSFDSPTVFEVHNCSDSPTVRQHLTVSDSV